MQNNNSNETKNFAYKIGQAVGVIVCLCVAAIAVALTAKFIMWIL